MIASKIDLSFSNGMGFGCEYTMACIQLGVRVQDFDEILGGNTPLLVQLQILHLRKVFILAGQLLYFRQCPWKVMVLVGVQCVVVHEIPEGWLAGENMVKVGNRLA